MTYISARHSSFGELMGTPEVLTSPEKYFGPNYKILLNFWIYWESLTSNQRLAYLDRRRAIGSCFKHAECARGVVGRWYVNFYYFEMEIIGAHKLISLGESLEFIPLLEDL